MAILAEICDLLTPKRPITAAGDGSIAVDAPIRVLTG
jgi:hypothetical protein